MINDTSNKTSVLSVFFTRMYVRSVGFASKKYESLFDEFRKSSFSNLQGIVVEIGPGTGPNIRYFPDSISYIGIEKERLMGSDLEKELSKKNFKRTEIIYSGAENIPLSDGSVDNVVSTLVL